MEKSHIIHNAIKQYYTGLGRTEDQWQEVTKDPEKFNIVWRRALKLSGDGVPPENFRNINPLTGEILNNYE